jgi:signal peptidase II
MGQNPRGGHLLKAVTKGGVAAYGLAILVILMDQVAKHWIVYDFDLPTRMTSPVIGPFHLTMVWNQGVSFGMLKAGHDLARWALTAFAVAAAIAMAAWARKAERPLMAVGLGLMIGGAIGNAIDRARYGAVVDFLDFTRLFFPWIFNIADSALTVGVILLLLDSLRKDAAA